MIVVYGLSDEVVAVRFPDNDLNGALKLSGEMRKTHKNVCISSEPGDMVGKFGVDVVENGTLPDGEKYDWSKAHRAGMRPAKE